MADSRFLDDFKEAFADSLSSTLPPIDGIGTKDTAKPAADNALKAWPIMDAKARHGIVGHIAAIATENSEADPVAVIATTLTYAAAMLGTARWFDIGDTHHHSRHFVAIVGQSARGRKGTSFGPVKRIFCEAERIIQSGSTILFPLGNTLQVRPGPLSSGEGLIWNVRDPTGDGENADPGVADKRLLIVEEEFGSALRAIQRSGNNLSTILRKAWDGETLAPMTKNNRLIATHPHINIVCHITLPELKDLMAGTEIWNGFANRFQWIMARRTKQLPFPKPMTDDLVVGAGEYLADVITKAHQSPQPMALSGPATDLWASAYPEVTKDYPGILGAVTSRQEAHARRLALTYALLDGAPRIELQHLEAGIAFTRYAFDSADYLFDAAEDLSETAQKILEELESGPKPQSYFTNVIWKHPPADLVETLKLLQERGRITATKEQTKGRPRLTWSR